MQIDEVTSGDHSITFFFDTQCGPVENNNTRPLTEVLFLMLPNCDQPADSISAFNAALTTATATKNCELVEINAFFTMIKSPGGIVVTVKHQAQP